jgi:hypothetical protein
MKDCMKNKKCSHILDIARNLFWKHGFKRITVEEICNKAKVSKVTFYKFFRNKTELAKAVFDTEIIKGVNSFKKIMEEESSPEDKMHKFILMKVENTHDISKEFLQDFYNDADSELTKHISLKTQETWTNLVSDFKKAQEKGWIRKDLKPECLIFFSRKLIELVGDEQLLAYYSTPGDLINDITRILVYGIGNKYN